MHRETFTEKGMCTHTTSAHTWRVINIYTERERKRETERERERNIYIF